MKDAACRGKYHDENGNDRFFPPQGSNVPAGIYSCMECPIKTRQACDEYRTRTGSEEGLWGGRIKES